MKLHDVVVQAEKTYQLYGRATPRDTLKNLAAITDETQLVEAIIVAKEEFDKADPGNSFTKNMVEVLFCVMQATQQEIEKTKEQLIELQSAAAFLLADSWVWPINKDTRKEYDKFIAGSREYLHERLSPQYRFNENVIKALKAEIDLADKYLALSETEKEAKDVALVYQQLSSVFMRLLTSQTDQAPDAKAIELPDEEFRKKVAAACVGNKRSVRLFMPNVDFRSAKQLFYASAQELLSLLAPENINALPKNMSSDSVRFYAQIARFFIEQVKPKGLGLIQMSANEVSIARVAP